MVSANTMSQGLLPVSGKGKGKLVILNDIPDVNKPNLLRDLKTQFGESSIRIIDSYIMNKPPTCDRLERNLRFLYIQQLLKLVDQGCSVIMTTSKLDTPSNREDLLNLFQAVHEKQHKLVWVNVNRRCTKVDICECDEEAEMSTAITGFTLSCHPRGIHCLRVCKPGDGTLQ
ncbi:hypothetical protein NW768_003695 [Fusarium equiseti]|uniref:Uncharacterized protein n=1 Tax=Fusarium equiseti TaxID=61235 RepID=A0ABQ8RID3_FUSEQ|nr:hypothetical protein NW768_003695 [Fusarium equiseti]